MIGPGQALDTNRFHVICVNSLKLVDSIEALCLEVDAVLLTGVDGRQQLAQARPVLAARKRVFIDKPAGSFKDAHLQGRTGDGRRPAPRGCLSLDAAHGNRQKEKGTVEGHSRRERREVGDETERGWLLK
jgi:hypothetical protein